MLLKFYKTYTMKKFNLLLLIFGFSFTLFQAQTSKKSINESHFKTSDLVDLDLSSKGYNVITKAPKGARIIQDGKDIAVYGGKFFKMTFSKQDFSNPFNEDEKYSSIEEKVADIKTLASDKEMNPGFVKFEAEDKNGFLNRSTVGGLSFTYGVKAGDNAIMISDGITYDISPDKFTKYTDEDIRVMYEAAKATVAK